MFNVKWQFYLLSCLCLKTRTMVYIQVNPLISQILKIGSLGSFPSELVNELMASWGFDVAGKPPWKWQKCQQQRVQSLAPACASAFASPCSPCENFAAARFYDLLFWSWTLPTGLSIILRAQKTQCFSFFSRRICCRRCCNSTHCPHDPSLIFKDSTSARLSKTQFWKCIWHCGYQTLSEGWKSPFSASMAKK